MNEKQIKIFCDLDGVLVNWHGGLCKLLDIDPFDQKAQEILKSNYMIKGWKFGTAKEVDEAVNNAGYDFWIELHLLPWAKRLVTMCEKYGELYFLTSPGSFHAGAHAKLDYLWEHFGKRADNYILTKHKYLCAHENHILVDDLQKNIHEWIDGGGIPFFWPNQWNLLENPKLLEETFIRLESLLKDIVRK